ncbi:unnamed protein product [Heterosigma akashiwo]|mmetsp:Transcript_31552/g.46207  ORF Transcript_31552/g.46207 Transcript_31552/m.46207 type:complete len:88 (+) Transcript_31552:63-326(+)
MHPPLFKPHPLCQQFVDALVKCHEQNAYMKFFGECNDAKAALDRCFREEKEERRKKNKAKADAFAERLKNRQQQQNLPITKAEEEGK